VELMIHGDEVYFADVTARPQQSAWVTARSQRLSAFELQARATLGLPVDTMMNSPGAARAIGPGSPLPGVGAVAGALQVPESDVRVFGRGADPRLWVAMATAPDVAAARERARQVATRAYVPDSNR
ncbi:MAG: phosphoribosylglycinamide formyltransferase 2, partial [Mycobacterium sp.]|nr:phosphoribosylglycinamide formyltransferase 2 [Mycobacterium sp.]